jgi:hypothetical protein
MAKRPPPRPTGQVGLYEASPLELAVRAAPARIPAYLDAVFELELLVTNAGAAGATQAARQVLALVLEAGTSRPLPKKYTSWRDGNVADGPCRPPTLGDHPHLREIRGMYSARSLDALAIAVSDAWEAERGPMKDKAVLRAAAAIGSDGFASHLAARIRSWHGQWNQRAAFAVMMLWTVEAPWAKYLVRTLADRITRLQYAVVARVLIAADALSPIAA